MAKAQQASITRQCREESERDIAHAQRLAAVLQAVLQQVAPGLLPAVDCQDAPHGLMESMAALHWFSPVAEHIPEAEMVQHYASQEGCSTASTPAANVDPARAFCQTATAAAISQRFPSQGLLLAPHVSQLQMCNLLSKVELSACLACSAVAVRCHARRWQASSGAGTADSTAHHAKMHDMARVLALPLLNTLLALDALSFSQHDCLIPIQHTPKAQQSASSALHGRVFVCP